MGEASWSLPWTSESDAGTAHFRCPRTGQTFRTDLGQGHLAYPIPKQSACLWSSTAKRQASSGYQMVPQSASTSGLLGQTGSPWAAFGGVVRLPEEQREREEAAARKAAAGEAKAEEEPLAAPEVVEAWRF